MKLLLPNRYSIEKIIIIKENMKLLLSNRY